MRAWVAGLLVLFAAVAPAQEELSIKEAAAHVGKTATVRGSVNSVSRPSNGHVYLNFGGAFPNQVFSVFIRQSDAGAFADLEALRGREISVSGRIELYREKPQIAVTSPSQIQGGEEPAVAPEPKAAVAEPPKTAPATSTGLLSGLRPGSPFTFRVPLSAEAQKFARTDGNPGAVEATVGVCIPPSFDPSRSWPVLVVFSTSDGDFSHVRRMNAFTRTATAKGWVVLAADGPSKPPHITPEWCWAMLSSGLDALEKEWPAVKTWSFACGGNSGGAKMSGLMAPLMASENLKICGIFMGGCNADTLSIGQREYRPPGGFKKTPVYLSSGTEDRTASPAQVAAVAAAIKGAGFRNLRLETYQGGHLMDDGQVAAALDWFVKESAGP